MNSTTFLIIALKVIWDYVCTIWEHFTSNLRKVCNRTRLCHLRGSFQTVNTHLTCGILYSCTDLSHISSYISANKSTKLLWGYTYQPEEATLKTKLKQFIQVLYLNGAFRNTLLFQMMKWFWNGSRKIYVNLTKVFHRLIDCPPKINADSILCAFQIFF